MQTSCKIKQALALYEEVYQLELAMFQVPIDLKTLFPQYPFWSETKYND